MLVCFIYRKDYKKYVEGYHIVQPELHSGSFKTTLEFIHKNLQTSRTCVCKIFKLVNQKCQGDGTLHLVKETSKIN